MIIIPNNFEKFYNIHKSEPVESKKRKLEEISTNSDSIVSTAEKAQKIAEVSLEQYLIRNNDAQDPKIKENTFDEWFNNQFKDIDKTDSNPFEFEKSEFETAIKLLSKCPDFEERMNKFQKLFRDGSLWLSFDDTKPEITVDDRRYVVIMLKTGSYSSAGINRKYLEKNPKNYHLNVYEYDNKVKKIMMKPSLLHVRVGEKNGELTWVNKGTSIQGSEVLNLYKLLEKTLSGPKLYVFDDAKIYIDNPENEKTVPIKEGDKKPEPRSILLRIFLPLSRCNGKTLYEDLGFNDVPKLENWKDKNGNPLNSRADRYVEDRNYLRNIKMKELHHIYKNTVDIPEKINEIMKKVFAGESSFKHFKNSEVTLHEFIEGIVKLKKIKKINEQELNELEYQVQELLFNPYAIVNKLSKNEKRYREALLTMDETVIRTKTVPFTKNPV